MAVGLAAFDDGGYSAGSRTRFAIVAGLAAVAAWRAHPARARATLREPVVVVLGLLAGLGALSALWTQGSAGDALHWAAATAGFGAVAFAGAVLVRGEREVRVAAAVLAVVAIGMALIGLFAAAVADAPLAHRAAGLWRPASTFQYSPALALLVVSALPALLAAMCRARRVPAAALAGFGGAVAGATLSLAESRTQLAFAVLVAAVLLARPRLVRCSRPELALAIALLAATGLGAYAAAGGYVPVTPPPDDAARLGGLAAVLALGTLAWVAARAGLRRGVPVALLVSALLGAGGAAAVVKPAPRIISSGVVEAGERPRAPARPAEDLDPIRDRLLHGRLEIWRAALDTFADRPLVGGGADAYYVVSTPHQTGRTVFYAHSLPLELGAELGVAGLLLALALYAAAGRALWRGRAGPAAGLLGAGAVAFLAANIVDWPWHLAGAGAAWALALGGIIGAAGATRGRH